MDFLTLPDADVANKKVLVRVDFNVPQDESGNITDDTRLRASLKTIQYLLDKNAKIILMSHLGRPDGKIVESLRLDKVAHRLSEILGTEVRKLDNCIGLEVEMVISIMQSREIIMLENLRFHPEEEQNDAGFAKSLAKLGEIYVNDAFGASHRAHASVAAIAEYLPSYAGFLLEGEIKTLTELTSNPVKPFVVILGGAKVSDKIKLVENLLKYADNVLIGGAMANTFLKAEGLEMGASKIEDSYLENAKKLLAENKEKIVLPSDVVAGFTEEMNFDVEIVNFLDKQAVHENLLALDIGPLTITAFVEKLSNAATIVWNGPLGYSELERFSGGTTEIARLLAESSAKTIVGGGDTIAVLDKLKLTSKMKFVSSGGGAMLELLEGKILPAIAALEEAHRRIKP